MWGVRNTTTHENRNRAAQRLGDIYSARYALFVDLRKGYSSTIKMGEAGSTRVSFLQNILIGRHNLTERVCARLETGINLPGYFGLPALRREQLHELPIRYQELLESVPDEQLLAQFRYHRVIDYLRHESHRVWWRLVC